MATVESPTLLRIRTPKYDTHEDADDAYRSKIVKRRMERCCTRTLYTFAAGVALYTLIQTKNTDYQLFRVILYLLLATLASAGFVLTGVKVCMMLGACEAQHGDEKEDPATDEPGYSV